jgi:hypothetical protein
VWAFERLLGRLDVLLKPSLSNNAETQTIARLATRLLALDELKGPGSNYFL